MFDLDGSDISWLVYADYLEDQDIDASHIREEVSEPSEGHWHFIMYLGHGVGCSRDIVCGGVGWSSNATPGARNPKSFGDGEVGGADSHFFLAGTGRVGGSSHWYHFPMRT